MNKQFLILAALSLSSGVGYAQNSAIDSDLDAELEMATSNRAAPQTATGSPAGAAIAPQGSVNGGQPIYILNQATPTSTSQVQQSQVQKQPQVDIQASPLNKSRAEQIREARQQAEVETENKVVEKLESSRMDDEKRRANALFGEPFNQLANQNNINAQNVNVQQQQAVQPIVQQQQQPIPQPIPVQYVTPVKHERDEDFADERPVDRERLREEIRASLKAEAEVKPEPNEQKYFGAIIGVGDYPDVSNVRGNYLVGATFGTRFDDSYVVEGTFTYSNYSVDELSGGNYYSNYGYYVPRTVDVRQYSGSLAVKYLFLDGMVKPVLGGLVQYSYRTFSWSQDPYSTYNYGYNYGYGYGANSYNNSGSGDASSHAIDLGVVTGVDFQFSKKWSLGLDFRYMYNMASRVNTNTNSAFLTAPTFGTPIEKLQYYTLGLIGRANF